MSGFEMEPVDEAQFSAFLQGKDELSRLLRSMPQPQPAPELDQAILAMISQQMLGQAVVDQEKAANDAEFSAANSQPRSFFQRFRLPLSLAASASLVFPLTLWHLGYLQEYEEESAAQIETVGQTSSTDTTAHSSPSASARMAEVSATASSPAANPATRPVQAVTQAATMAKPLDKPDQPMSPAPGDSAESEVFHKADTPMMAKSSPAKHPTNSPEVGAQGTLTDAQRDAAMRRAKEKQEALQIDDARRQAELAAQASQAKKSRQAAAVAPSQALAEPQAAPVAAEKPANTLEQAEMAKPSLAAEQAEHHARAKAWLQLIDELIKAKLREEALQEWQKFKKAYPYHPVPERLQEQIKAMQK